MVAIPPAMVGFAWTGWASLFGVSWLEGKASDPQGAIGAGGSITQELERPILHPKQEEAALFLTRDWY